MEFKIKQSVLKDALRAVSGVVVKGSTIPILSNILLESIGENEVRITGTDLDITIRRDAEAEIISPGAICIEGRRLTDITNNLADVEMTFTTEENDWVRLHAGTSKFRFGGRPRGDFPAEVFHKNKPVVVPMPAFQSLIHRTAFAISTTTTQQVMHSAKLEIADGNARMVVTDGARLPVAETSVETDDPVDVLIPRKALGELVKIQADEVGIGIDTNHIFFETSDQMMICRRLTGTYLNYERVIPKENDQLASFDVEEMKAAIRRASFMADDFLKTIRFEIATGEISITAVSSEAGEADERVKADYEGETVLFGFTWQHVLEFLSIIGDAKRATISFKDAKTPVIFGIEGDDSYQYTLVCLNLAVQKNKAEAKAA